MEAEYKLTVRTFRLGTDGDVAAKILEEAAESFASYRRLAQAWVDYGDALYASEGTIGDFSDEYERRDLADELADVVQAACNLAARYQIDMAGAMARCEAKNRVRGRYE